jgi:hypothetical protein
LQAKREIGGGDSSVDVELTDNEWLSVNVRSQELGGGEPSDDHELVEWVSCDGDELVEWESSVDDTLGVDQKYGGWESTVDNRSHGVENRLIPMSSNECHPSTRTSMDEGHLSILGSLYNPVDKARLDDPLFDSVDNLGSCSLLLPPMIWVWWPWAMQCIHPAYHIRRPLIRLALPLLRCSCPVLGYIHHIDALFMYLSYGHRSRERKVDDGNVKKESGYVLVPSHFRVID